MQDRDKKIEMKVGDLVRVRYRGAVAPVDDIAGWSDPYVGIITETPESKERVWKMWCVQTGSFTIIVPTLDSIEVLNSIPGNRETKGE